MQGHTMRVAQISRYSILGFVLLNVLQSKFTRHSRSNQYYSLQEPIYIYKYTIYTTAMFGSVQYSVSRGEHIIMFEHGELSANRQGRTPQNRDGQNLCKTRLQTSFLAQIVTIIIIMPHHILFHMRTNYTLDITPLHSIPIYKHTEERRRFFMHQRKQTASADRSGSMI